MNSALKLHKYSLAREIIVCSAEETNPKKFMNHIVIKLPSINKFSDHECHTISHQKVHCRFLIENDLAKSYHGKTKVDFSQGDYEDFEEKYEDKE